MSVTNLFRFVGTEIAQDGATITGFGVVILSFGIVLSIVVASFTRVANSNGSGR